VGLPLGREPPAAPLVSGSGLELLRDDSPEHPCAPWFAIARRRRREHYAGRPKTRPGSRSRALITIVHNEPVFLPIWLRYYSRFFAPHDIYVLDNESSDDIGALGDFVRIPAAHDRVDHEWMVKTIEGLQHDLVDRYDVVLVSDVDELVVPHPRAGTLGEYLDRFDEDWVNCLGYELLHMRDSEPPLELDRPILEQRGYWFSNGAYDKAALATVPMSWQPGFHGRADFQYNFDPDLRLIHLHRMDYDLCLARHRVRSRRAWDERDARNRWAVHNQIIDEQEFRRWFYEDSCFENFEIKPERIPQAWRELF
jgi:hypothetical protein